MLKAVVQGLRTWRVRHAAPLPVNEGVWYVELTCRSFVAQPSLPIDALT